MDLKNAQNGFHLNIGQKLLLGYLTLIFLSILSALFALHYFKRLNSINESIITTNIPVIQTVENMIDSIYSQELYGHRYMILKSNRMLSLYEAAVSEFRNQQKRLKNLLPDKTKKAIRIDDLHKEYGLLFQDWFSTLENRSNSKIPHEKLLSEKQSQLINFIQELSNQNSHEQENKTLLISTTGMKAFRIIAVLCLIGIIFGMGAAWLITRNISRAINHLMKSTREISQGNFDTIPEIKSRDEFGKLIYSFGEMAKRLKKLEEMYLDANPLTRLPGGIAIENILKKRIKNRTPFAFCLVDLDHFKVFNDHFGYGTGNKVIIATSRIIEKTVKQYGNKNDFIGHIGGDDFVIITSHRNYKRICQAVAKSFDEKIVEFYDEKDIKKGFIEAVSRSGKQEKFPIMSVSIAVVTNKKKKYEHHIQVSEVAAELKKYAKSFPYSLIIEDRRKTP